MCQQNPSQIGYFKAILGSFEKSLFFDYKLLREGVGTRKWSLKLWFYKTSKKFKNVMCQQNPSQIGYFKPILGSFEKSLFFDLPLREGVDNRKWSLKL